MSGPNESHPSNSNSTSPPPVSAWSPSCQFLPDSYRDFLSGMNQARNEESQEVSQQQPLPQTNAEAAEADQVLLLPPPPGANRFLERRRQLLVRGALQSLNGPQDSGAEANQTPQTTQTNGGNETPHRRHRHRHRSQNTQTNGGNETPHRRHRHRPQTTQTNGGNETPHRRHRHRSQTTQTNGENPTC